METWAVIPEFPTYRVSDEGRVANDATGRILRSSETRTGIVKVGLVQAGVQHTRSVAVLVADAFVAGKDELFDTPIHLDGDRHNNAASNLMWRPRWFAWKYTRQFGSPSIDARRGPIRDLASNEVYRTLSEASRVHGLLIEDVWKSIAFNRPTFPTEQIFKFVK